MKRMLINATQEEELRMAMVDGQRLYDLNIELPSGERKKANIYKGEITRIEPSLEAAFVNFGGERHGFLPLKEISSEYFLKDVPSGSKPNIKDVLKEGQDIVVQVDKEERGNKGAALTTFVSLAGRFIVLKPNKARSGGVSRRIVGEDRDAARDSLQDVTVPKGMSVILRTAGIDRSAEELDWDLQNLLGRWEALKAAVVEVPSPKLMLQESNAIQRALRDYLTNDIGEILIDDDETYNEASQFVEFFMPHNQRKLKHYKDPVPLFTRYQIESQIESAFAHSVNLPSGGSVVIDHTEALVSIDINSARATKGSDIETTAFNTNLEAADEVARQLRLRDLGGLVVIDFIDMGPQRNQREVENRLREAVRQDRARVQIGKISRFGLLEMSRQRLRPSLGESSYLVCPRCSGIGNIRSVESLALAILRIIGEEARKERTSKVVAQLPVEVATYLLNEKRDWVQNVEAKNDTQVIMVANPALETPHYNVRRVRDDQTDLPENTGLSYTLADTPDEDEVPEAMQPKKPAEQPAIVVAAPTAPPPPRQEPKKPKQPGLFKRIAAFFVGDGDEDEQKSGRRGDRKSRGRSDNRRRDGQRKRGGDSRRQSEGRGSQQRSKKSSKKRAKTGGGERKARGQRGEKQDNKQQGKQGQDGKSEAREARADGEQGEARKTTSRRRSRGGRRRRRSKDAADTQDSTAATTEQQATEGVTEAATEAPADASAEAKPARSRSRRGRKTDDEPVDKQADAGDVTEQADKPVAADSSETAQAPVEDVAAAADADAIQADAPAEATGDADVGKSKPRRKRTRKAAPKKDAEKPADEAVAASDESGDDAAPEADPAPKKKRRSRSKKSSSKADQPQTDATPAASDDKVEAADDAPKGSLLPWANDESAAAATPAAAEDTSQSKDAAGAPEPAAEPDTDDGNRNDDSEAVPKATAATPSEPEPAAEPDNAGQSAVSGQSIDAAQPAEAAVAPSEEAAPASEAEVAPETAPDYEDTQPELPVLKMSPADEVAAAGEADDDDTADGEDGQSAAANGEDDEEPQGRLLPWEPAAPAAGDDAPDKEVTDR